MQTFVETFKVLNAYIWQINAAIIKGYVAFYGLRLFYKSFFFFIIFFFKKNIVENSKDIYRSAKILNTEEYPRFSFEDILQISVKKIIIQKLFIKVIQHNAHYLCISLWLHTVRYYTTKIYDDCI